MCNPSFPRDFVSRSGSVIRLDLVRRSGVGMDVGVIAGQIAE